MPAGDDGSTTARDDATAGAEGDLSSAKSEWEAAARRFDGHYDTWDDAYDDAVNGLRDVNDDGVKDGFWDDALPFFETLVKVMEWAGLALLVLALVVGGPLIAALRRSSRSWRCSARSCCSPRAEGREGPRARHRRRHPVGKLGKLADPRFRGERGEPVPQALGLPQPDARR